MLTVAIAIFPGVQALDVAGPVDVFAETNGFLPPDRHYAITLVGAQPGVVHASNGIALVADEAFDGPRRDFDLALVAGGPALPEASPDANLTRWLADVAARCPRYGSICTGAFALGHAGLLDGRQVTTHWQHAQQLAEQFPRAHVDFDRIYLRDERLVTSAGVTAGIDLSLALVAEDHGPQVALSVAKRLVVFAQRQGGQSQFSPYLTAPADDTSPVAKVQAHVMQHLRKRFAVNELAEVAAMSARNFARVFVQQTGVTPHEFVERARVDAARTLLESSDAALKAVAWDCGFGTPDRMQIVFAKRIGATPRSIGNGSGTRLRQKRQPHAADIIRRSAPPPHRHTAFAPSDALTRSDRNMIHDPNEPGLPDDDAASHESEAGNEAESENAAADAASIDESLRLRRIRSFVTRAGRVSTGQRRALDEFGPRFVVPYASGQPDWDALFARRAPRVLEIGFGMGASTAEIAALRSSDDFLGVEVHEPGVGALLKLIGEQQLSNIRIIQHDAVEVIEHMIAPESLDGVHIFFPDPWHKARHHKRRLIQPKFVALLASRLKPDAYIHCATDWQNYAEQMLDVLGADPSLVNTADGYAPRPDYRPVTKFERRGLRLGHGVWDLVFRKRDA